MCAHETKQGSGQRGTARSLGVVVIARVKPAAERQPQQRSFLMTTRPTCVLGNYESRQKRQQGRLLARRPHSLYGDQRAALSRAVRDATLALGTGKRDRHPPSSKAAVDVSGVGGSWWRWWWRWWWLL